MHGVGGFLGIVLLGVFASTLWNPNGADGLLAGNPSFLGKQFVAAVVCSAWAFTFTYAMLWLINLVTPVKVDEVAEQHGLNIRPARRGGLSARRLTKAPNRNAGPNRLDDAEGPRPLQKAVNRAERARSGEGEDKQPAPCLEGVRNEHRGDGQQTEAR